MFFFIIVTMVMVSLQRNKNLTRTEIYSTKPLCMCDSKDWKTVSICKKKVLSFSSDTYCMLNFGSEAEMLKCYLSSHFKNNVLQV